MGKQGPCTHCGIGNTPLWRNGPPEKPILCNACGSRWRTRGTLNGYLPLHAGGLGLGLQGGSKHKKPKPAAPPKAVRVRASMAGTNGPLKRKQEVEEEEDAVAELFDESDDEQLFAPSPPRAGVVEEGGRMDVAGKSLPRGDYSGLEDWELTDDEEEESDGGIVPRPRNGTKGMGRSASTGMLPSIGRAFAVPSRKRSTTTTTRLRVNSSSGLDTMVCEELMVHNMSPMVSMEMGLGSLMTRAPSCDTLESYGAAVGEFSYREERGAAMPRVPSVSSLRLGEHKQRANPPWRGQPPKRNRELLENFPYSKRTVLSSPNSPLAFVDWKDIVNCENFYARLEAGQRYMLLQMLPPGDTAEGQSSVAAMFASPRFTEALGGFQKLMAGGMFDPDSRKHSREVKELYEALRDPNRLSLGGQGGWWEAWGQVADEGKAQLRQCGKKETGGKAASGEGGRRMYTPRPPLGPLSEPPNGIGKKIAQAEGEREGILGPDISSVWDERESGRCREEGSGLVGLRGQVLGAASSQGCGYAESSVDIPSLFSIPTPDKSGGEMAMSGGGEVSPTDDLLPGGGWIEGWDSPSSDPPRIHPGAV